MIRSMRAALACLLLLLFSLASAVDTFVQLPKPAEQGYAEALEVILPRVPSHWTGVSVGWNQPYEATKPDHAPYIELAHLVFSRGGKLAIRPTFYVNPNSPSWQQLAGDQAFDAIYYPPAGPSDRLHKRMGWNMRTLVEALISAADQYGLPRTHVIVMGPNEMNSGGVTGPYYRPWNGGAKEELDAAYAAWDAYLAQPTQENYDKWLDYHLTVMPPWTIVDGKPIPYGALPDRFFGMADMIRRQVPVFRWGIIWDIYTFEADSLEGAGRAELDSWLSPAAEKYARTGTSANVNLYSVSNINRWVKDPVTGKWYQRDLTPEEAVQKGIERYARYKKAFEDHPVLQRFANTLNVGETNVKLDFVPGDTEEEKLANVHAYRQAWVDGLPLWGAARFNVFVSVASGPAGSRFDLFYIKDGKASPVGGKEVAPGLDGP